MDAGQECYNEEVGVPGTSRSFMAGKRGDGDVTKAKGGFINFYGVMVCVSVYVR